MSKIINLAGQAKQEMSYIRNKIGLYHQGFDKNGKPLLLIRLSDDIELNEKPLKIICNSIKGGIDEYSPTGSLNECR